MKKKIEDHEALNRDLLVELAECHEICRTLVKSVMTSSIHTLRKMMDELSATFVASIDEPRRKIEEMAIQIGLL